LRVLVVEDETNLSQIIKRGLVEEGYFVDCAFDGEEGQDMAELTSFDVIILDIMLPLKDGISVCRDLRAKKISAPILMLTARDGISDRVKGLDAGADDYLVKPFDFHELLARLRALLRRGTTSRTSKIFAGKLSIDTVTREAKRDDKLIELTAKEFAILEYFMRHPNVLVTRSNLEQCAWDYDFDAESNIVDVYIKRLRGKIDIEDEDSLIQTVRGFGYRLKV
jgi:DNA-binding response OmpR family regulator